jgi:NarL family two-component system response regulator LiaR
MEMPIRILIVDDHDILRKGLSYLFGAQPDILVIGEAANGVEAIHQAVALNPDVILMDLEMPGKDGVEAAREILHQNPRSRILVLTSFSDNRRISAIIQAGALGYITKTSSPEELLRAIRQIYRGETYFPSEIISKLVDRENLLDLIDTLTHREHDVLLLIGKGLSNKEIAENLFLSEKTIETYVTNILRKLRLENRTQAALFVQKYL